MIQISQDSDNLTLSLIKNQLYVDIVEDDTLITAYKEASLRTCQRYMSSDILSTTYNSTTFENIKRNNCLVLELDYKPKTVKITLSSQVPDNILDSSYGYFESTNLVNTIEVSKDFYSYLNTELLIDIANINAYGDIDITNVEVKNGSTTVPKSINQARMIMIAGWYANREPSTSMAVNELPFSVTLLLDLETNSVI